jgi:hypothetical protein
LSEGSPIFWEKGEVTGSALNLVLVIKREEKERKKERLLESEYEIFAN